MKNILKIKITTLLILILTIIFSVNIYGAENQKDEVPEKVEINLEDGYYKIPIALWHAIEDKESMGNQAMNQIGELEVKDKEGFLYIGSDKMKYMSITASLINIYFQKEDGNYYPAEPGAFEMEIPKEKEKRPIVFRTKLVNMDNMQKVYVDPKVEPMGDEPIRARVKLDFTKVEKISEDESVLINKFKNGAKKAEYSKEDSGEVENKNLFVSYGPDTFTEEFSFYGNKLSGKDAEEYSKDFDPLDQVNVFKIEFLGPLEKITGKEDSIQATRKKLKPEKEFELSLPLLKFTKEDNLALYDCTEGEKQKIDFTYTDEHIKAKVKNPGVYLLVKSGSNPVATSEGKQENKTPNKTTKEQRGKAFTKSVKKPVAKPVNKSAVNRSTTPQINQTQMSKQPVQSSLQKQLDVVNGEKGKNENIEYAKENIEENIKEKESKGIITLILLTFIFFNTAAIIIIKKNLGEIKNMKEEILFIGGLKKDEE